MAWTETAGQTSTTTWYYYDGWRVVQERDDNHDVAATYVYGNYIDELLQMQRGGENYYYHADDQFNVLRLTDDGGNVVETYDYDDYGKLYVYNASNTYTGGASQFDNPFTFQGQWHDSATGLYHFRTRFLDPSLGRFLSRDAIGIWGDPSNLGNGQGFVGNNPWTYVDPFGLEQSLSGDPYIDELIRQKAKGENVSATPEMGQLRQDAKDFGVQVGIFTLLAALDLGLFGDAAKGLAGFFSRLFGKADKAADAARAASVCDNARRNSWEKVLLRT